MAELGRQFFRYTACCSAKDRYLGPSPVEWRRHCTMKCFLEFDWVALPGHSGRGYRWQLAWWGILHRGLFGEIVCYMVVGATCYWSATCCIWSRMSVRFIGGLDSRSGRWCLWMVICWTRPHHHSDVWVESVSSSSSWCCIYLLRRSLASWVWLS